MASEAATKENKGSVFSRTATFTTKRALRATEKVRYFDKFFMLAIVMRGRDQVMQKLGKSAPTKDETFAEFVSNSSRQQVLRSIFF